MLKRAQPPVESPPSALALKTVAELFENVPEAAFFVKDRLGRYTAVNGSLVKRAGLKHRQDLIGKHVREIFPPDMAAHYERQDQAVLRTGRPLRDHLELHWRAGRRRGWCLTTKLPLRDAEGNVTGLVGISRDLPGPVDAVDLPAGLARAVEHLRKRYAEPVSPSSLARAAGMTPLRFARLTKRLFGLTPTQLILQTRLNAAVELLEQPGRGVAETAVACGFTDHSAFTRAFRRALGMTPTAFRQRNG